jgi:hypothetical protein
VGVTVGRWILSCSSIRLPVNSAIGTGNEYGSEVEALSRALDVTGSRYVVTVILAGAILAEGIEALSETCRVLQVEGITLDPGGTPLDEAAREQLNDRIRVLLPLTLPIADIENSGSGPAIDQLVRSLPKYLNKELLDAVIAASIDGEQAVTEAVAGVIDQALQSGTAEEQS